MSAKQSSIIFCDACSIGKLHQSPHVSKPLKTTKPFQLIHSDLWGPAHTATPQGYKYYIHFIDDYSRYTWIYPLTLKSETLSVVQQFFAMIKCQFSATIQSFQSDWGGEYRSLVPFFQALGVHFQHPCPHIHTQNGRAERKHQHIVDVGLTLLSQASIPLDFWWHAFAAATYLINRLPTQTLNMKSPYQVLYNTNPDYAYLHVFGCAAFPYLKPYNSHKLAFRSQKCIFLGYSTNHRGYKCLSSNGRLYIADTVKFNECEFPYSAMFSSAKSACTNTCLPVSSFSASLPQTEPPPTSPASNSPAPSPQQSSSNSSSPTDTSSDSDSTATPTPPINQLDSSISNTHTMITRSKHGIRKPKIYIATLDGPPIQNLSTQIPSLPLSLDEALSHKGWLDAMTKEFDAIVGKGTWKLIPPDPAQKIISNKWIFRVKLYPDYTLDKLKARLVARGFEQLAGVDFVETYSPVVKPSTIRLMFSLAATKGWSIQQIDVNNAFLNGELTDTIYMAQPAGFEDSEHPDYVCKLEKAIYGLKQAPRAWYETLKTKICHLGFQRSESDFSLFYQRKESHLTLILVYVDDILVTGDDPSIISHVIDTLHNKFSVKNMGNVSYFLGIEVQHPQDSFLLCQHKYIHELLSKTKMVDCKACPTPMTPATKLSRADGVPFEDPTLYRSIVGALQYLTLTRPDIAYCVNKLSQFLQSPTTLHWAACKRLLRYLKGTATMKLQFTASPSSQLVGYSDADWASCVDDRRSTGGHCIFLGSNLITWSAKKQEVVSRSSAESEYRSMATATTDLVWLQNLCSELGISLQPPHKLWCDNVSAIALAGNPVFHARTKHIEVDVHYIRERVQDGTIEVGHVPSFDQVADVLTKPLAESRFSLLRERFKVISGDPG